MKLAKEKIIKISDRLIEYSFLAIIFLIPIYFAFLQENYNIFDLNKLIIFRILLLVILLIYTAKIFLAGKVETRHGASVRGNGLFFWLIFLIFLSFLLSTIFSLQPQLSLWGSYERQQGLYSLANYLLLAVLLVLFSPSGKIIRKIIIAVICSAFIASLYGLTQYFYLDPLNWSESALSSGRIFSTLGQPNSFGHYLILVIPVTVYGLFFLAKKFLIRTAVAILLALELWCLLATYSRGAWLGFLAMVIAAIILILFLKKKHQFAAGAIITIFLALALIISLNLASQSGADKSGANNLINRVKSIFDLRSGSNKIRLYYWQAASQEIANASWQRLILGNGPETLDSVFVKYYRPEWGIYEKINTYPDRAHNLILDIILTYGLAGLLALLLFFGYLFYSAGKYLLSQNKLTQDDWLIAALLIALVGYFVNNIFSFSLTVAYLYLYLYAALIWLLVNQLEGERQFSLSLSLFSKIVIWTALLTVGWLFIYYQNVNIWLADFYYIKVKRAEVRADCQAIFTNLEKVVDYNPASTFYKEHFIKHYLNCFSTLPNQEDQIVLQDNVIAQANSIGSREYQYNTWLNIAHAKALFGFSLNADYYQSAEADYQRLIAINPYLTLAYKDLGRMKLWQKNYNQAIVYFKQALKVAPPLDHVALNEQHRQQIINEIVALDELLGMSYAGKQDFEQAQEYYYSALKLDPSYLPLYKKIADIYYQQNQLDKAIFFNQRGLMLNPGDYKWHLALALLYREKNNLLEAEKYLDQALRLAPESEALKKYEQELNN